MWSVQSAPQVLSSSQRSVTGSVDQRQNALQAGSRDLPRNIRPLLSFLVRRDRAFGATLGALGAGQVANVGALLTKETADTRRNLRLWPARAQVEVPLVRTRLSGHD